MKRRSEPPLSTFIIRFWQESGSDAPLWRGQAQHIQSGEQVIFTDETMLIDFIRRWVMMPVVKGNALGDDSEMLP
jgi:hypothetical protein